MIFKKKLLVALLCSASFVALSACGGGGGGSINNNGGNDTPDTPDTPAEVFDPAEPAKAQMAQYPAPSASDEPASVSGAVTVFYYNIDEDRSELQKYNLHVWNKSKTAPDVDASKVQSVETNGGSDWANTSLTPAEVNDYGAKFVLPITEDDQDVFYFIIRKADGNTKVYGDLGPYAITPGRVLIVGGAEATVFNSVSDAYAALTGTSSDDDSGNAGEAVEGKVSIYVHSSGVSKADMDKLTLYTFEDDNIEGTSTVCKGEDGWGCTKITPESTDDGLAVFRLPILDEAGTFSFIVRTADNATQTADLSGNVSSTPINVTWDTTSNKGGSAKQSSSGSSLAPKDAAAIWIDKDTIVSTTKLSYATTDYARLYTGSSDDAVTGKGEDGNVDGKYINLEKADTLTTAEATAYPELAKGVESGDYTVWNIPEDQRDTAKSWLKKDLVFAGINKSNALTQFSKVQPAGAIDDYYGVDAFTNYSGKQLGAVVEDGGVTFRLWAPTARSVSAVLYDKDKKLVKEVPLTVDETGMWTATSSDAKANETYYRFKVKVFRPDTMKVAEYEVTDPYSLALSTNSEYSLVADLDADETKPAGWDGDEPAHSQATHQDLASIAVTETHLRDITVGADKGVSEAHQGKYLGLTETDTTVVKHLKALSDAGMTHIELLPIYDFSTVNEKKGKTVDLNTTCADAKTIIGSDVCSGSTIGAALKALAESDIKANDPSTTHGVSDLLAKIKNNDSYNWGYDPFHYGVPEGSYATDPEGLQRTVELRQMIESLHKVTKLNVVMDVVYNHTDGAGDPTKNSTSVLDAVVPWYYNRLDIVSGGVKAATCCKDSASEHKMFQKLMEDTLVTWVDKYHIDAFRFDLMGYIPKDVMQETLKNVKDRTNKDVFFFGEGWDPDSSASNKFTASTQKTMGGTGIGTFNDRIRDAVRGVGPFDHAGKTDEDAQNFMLTKKGFATGMCTSADVTADGNDARCSELGTTGDDASSSANKSFARKRMDWIRVSMAGGIKTFEYTDYAGNTAQGDNDGYWGSPVGYTEEPYETINYVSKHDNATLFDLITYTSTGEPDMKLQTRQQALGLATAILGQGVFFDQQGSDLLRSKSFENDSYNSGDFTNAVNYNDDETNGYGNGYSNESKDADDWYAVKQLYAATAKAPKAYNAGLQGRKPEMKAFYQELLKIRSTYKGFISLGDSELIKSDVKFLNTGDKQIVGLIAMEISTTEGKLLVAINATPDKQDLTALKADAGYTLVPVQTEAGKASISYNGDASTISAVQPWSVAVFKK